MASNSYLMMLYVTLEQESALRDFFVENGWMFCKPDMSVTTDALGPPFPFKQDPESETVFPEEDFSPIVQPAFPKIKITTRSSKLNTKKASESKKGKQKTSHKKPATRANTKKVVKEQTVSESEELEENTETADSSTSDNKDNMSEETHLIQMALDGTELSVKDESKVDDDDDEINDTEDIFDEESDGDEDDDFRDIEMDNEMEVEASESFKGETQSNANDSVTDESTTDSTATVKSKKQKNTTSTACTICFKSFASKSNLTKHMKRHGEKKFTCYVCSKGFFRLDEVKQHIMMVHEDRAPSLHICDVCGRMYKSKSGLQVHYAYKHGAEQADDLKCKVCGRILSCKKKRIDHERKHVEGFKFTKCELCGRMCKNIEDHKLYCTQSPVTERQKCGDCGAMFIDQRYLEKHMRRKHGFSYKCVACGLSFSDKKAVMEHTSKCFNIVIAEALEETIS